MKEDDIEKIMRKYENKRITRGMAIKIYCKEICCAGDYKSWAECGINECPLWNFRMGRENIHKNKDKVVKPMHAMGFEAKTTNLKEDAI